jgi:hypothetical protein
MEAVFAKLPWHKQPAYAYFFKARWLPKWEPGMMARCRQT